MSSPDGPRPGLTTGTVAVIGTGRMGAAMVGRLREAGLDVVAYNRTRSGADEVAARTGARVADSAREAASVAGVVVISLADDAAVRAVYESPDGLAAGLRPGSVVLETSTVDPETITEVAPLVTERGAELLDAPVSGSVPLVERGELTVMVGGESAALEQARPVLDVLAAKVFHVGPQGAGATMKLAVNSALHAVNAALSEALVLAEKAGIDRSAAYDVFAASAVASPFVLYKRAAFERPDETPVAFSLDLVAKDLDLIERLAERVGAPMEQAAATRRIIDGAVADGMGGRDMSAVAERLRASQP
jgi:3-hydroxyisobutyrate dehydrogenase/2-hydroxy-3-oxopropionate reductase